MLLSVKTKEHMRRRLAILLPKWGTLLGGAAALGATLLLTGTLLQVVRITDTAGQAGMVITAAQDMETLYEQTGVEPAGSEDELIATGETGAHTLHILRAYQVGLAVDGEEKQITMTHGTVADVLEKAGVTLGPDDEITPALDEPATADTGIRVTRVSYLDYTLEEVQPAETEYLYSSLFYRSQGYSQTLQTGSDGLAQVSYRETYRDGALTNTVETDRTVIAEMVPTIIKCYGEGAAVSHFEGPEIVDGQPAEGVANVFTACRATGYSASPTAKGASGRRLTYGTVAINPSVIPYGSLMYITSTDGRFVYGYAYAADTGIAMMDGRAFIDLYYETYDESVKNAVISVNIYVLDSETAAQYKETNDALLAADTIPGR